MNIYSKLKDVLIESENVNNFKAADQIAAATIRLAAAASDNEVGINSQVKEYIAQLENQVATLNLQNRYQALQNQNLTSQLMGAMSNQVPDGVTVQQSQRLPGAIEAILDNPVVPLTVKNLNNQDVNGVAINSDTNRATWNMPGNMPDSNTGQGGMHSHGLNVKQ
jgi:hypothetical protein